MAFRQGSNLPLSMTSKLSQFDSHNRFVTSAEAAYGKARQQMAPVPNARAHRVAQTLRKQPRRDFSHPDADWGGMVPPANAKVHFSDDQARGGRIAQTELGYVPAGDAATADQGNKINLTHKRTYQQDLRNSGYGAVAQQMPLRTEAYQCGPGGDHATDASRWQSSYQMQQRGMQMHIDAEDKAKGHGVKRVPASFDPHDQRQQRVSIADSANRRQKLQYRPQNAARKPLRDVCGGGRENSLLSGLGASVMQSMGSSMLNDKTFMKEASSFGIARKVQANRQAAVQVIDETLQSEKGMASYSSGSRDLDASMKPAPIPGYTGRRRF